MFCVSYRSLSIALAVLACAGCGNGKAPIKGTVAFAGKAVEQGTISFEPENGAGEAVSGLIQDGVYELAGEQAVPPGKKIVRIHGMRKTGKTVDNGFGGKIDEVKPYIPAKYNDRSSLTVEIVAGKANEHNFNLEP